MRIGLVHPYAWPEVRRGGERYLDDLAAYLLEAGHDVELITGATPTASHSADGVVTHRCPHRGARIGERVGLSEVDLFGMSAYPKLLRNRYDVVHALVPSAAVAARLAGQRVVYTLLGYPTRQQLGQRPGDERLYRTAVRLASAVTALSPGAARQVELLFGRRPDVLAPGVRLDRFPFQPQPRTGSTTVLYASDLSVRRKGLNVLVAAVVRLLPRYPGLRLVLAGPGDAGWAVDRLATEDRRRLLAVTQFQGVGDPEHLARQYAAATLTALPAREEAFGLVLVESLATGTPVVCCTGSGMTEIAANRSTGRLATYGDVDDLVRALEETIDVAADPHTPEACRDAAARYGWADHVGPAHEELYARVATRSARTSR